MNLSLHHFAAGITSISLLGLIPASAVNISNSTPYTQDFNSMGTAGTTPPADWSVIAYTGGGSGTWTSSIPASGSLSVGGGTTATSPVLTAATAFTATSATKGYNYALTTSTADRALGLSPTSVQGSALQLSVTNTTGSPLTTIYTGFQIRRFTVGSSTNELPGYWFFYSLDNGTSWTNVSALNSTITTVPNTIGDTTVPLTAITLGSALPNNSPVLFRWVDDNAAQSSPDQIIGLDNLTISSTAVPNQFPMAALTTPTAGASATLANPFILTATATDADGSISLVEFLRDGAVVGSDTSAPYSFTDSTTPAGVHTYAVRATDDLGAVTTTSVVTATVVTTANATALRFDGANDHVTMATAPQLATGSVGFTLECWFRKEGAGVVSSSGSGGVSAVPLFGKGRGESEGSNVDCNYFFGITTGGLLTADFEAYPAAGITSGQNYPVTAANTPIVNNTWYHAAVTYDCATTTWKLYLDGLQVGTAIAAANARPRFDSIQHFGIGTAMTSTGVVEGAFAGSIDEVRVWERALSSAEILAGKDMEIVSATSLIGRYGLNEGTGTTTANSARVDALPIGTLTNGPLWVDGPVLTPNDPPTVTLTTPVGGSSFVVPASVNLTANATDTDGSIFKVEFYQGVIKLGEDATAPYEYLWTLPNAAATYSLTAVATDNRGRMTTSATTSITANLPTNVSPTVTLTAPADAANFYFPAAINLSATAGDTDGNLAKVEFYRGTVKLGEDATAPFEYNWTNAAVGSYSITAVAIDTFNAATTSATAAITVTLPPNDPPFVTLDSPATGSNFVFPAPINLSATASDTDNNLVKVEFYQGTTKLGEDTTAPFEYTWTDAAIGSYILTAKAIDNQNATNTSNAASINVNLSSNVPPTVAVSAPADNTTGIGASTNLSVNIADPEGDAQTVTFYGRKRAPLVPGPDFTLGTLPDTQFYSQNTGGNRAATFYQQTQWFVDNRDTLNLAFVSHMGDMVQDNDSIDQQWVVASTAMSSIENQPSTLRAYGIPWGGAPGNHDVAGSGAGGGNAVNAKWNQYFGNSRWAGKPYYKGSFSGTSSGNNYQFFSASGLDFIIIHLEYMTSGNQAVLDWADSLLKAHPHRRAIVTSHWILNTPPTSPVPAQAPFGGPGRAIYDNLKDNPNLFMTLCGHIHNEGRRADVYQGRTVHSLLQDYQDRANGGDGWLRYYVFSPANGTILAKTYSPKLGIYETNLEDVRSPADTQLNEASEFTLAYDMQGSASDWIPLGTVNVAANGTTASLAWTGLEKSSAYEWYATANDGTNTANSSVAKFATVAAAAPAVSITSPVNSQSVGLPSAVNIAATATDADGSIAKVAFFNGSTLLNEDTTAPYEYAWNAPSGNHTLTAIATDNEGNATLSNVVTFSVFNAANIPPSVTLTSPVNGSSVEAGTISLTATATDTDGIISKVEFYNGAAKIGEDLTSPYNFDWTGVTVGTYTLTAKATDNDNGTMTSASASVTVTPAGVFVSSYFQNFDGMGLSGTARRPAWTSWNSATGTTNSTWTAATGITASGVAAMTQITAALAVANPPAATNVNGFNAGLTATNTDRQFGSSPTGLAGIAHQLELTNIIGSPIGSLSIGYDIRRYNATSSENELPGYWLFYSLDGTTWTNVSELNPTPATIPNTAGLTTIPPTNINLAGPWANNTSLRLRWVDDNGVPTSPDQMYGLDNVVIAAGVNAATALTAMPVVNGDGISLAWTDNSDNETGFRIERKPAADTLWNLLTTSPANATTHTDATAGPGVSFSYRVIAFNASVTGNPSNIANSTAYTALQDWKLATQGNPNAPNNSDGDGISDLFEFAFGLNPVASDAGPISVNITSGILTTRGQPAVWYQATSDGTDFRVLFIRRKDYLAAGLTYTPQFSGDMTTWVNSSATPTVVADGGEVEAVSIKYPFFAAGKKARFFRVGVSSNQ